MPSASTARRRSGRSRQPSALPREDFLPDHRQAAEPLFFCANGVNPKRAQIKRGRRGTPETCRSPRPDVRVEKKHTRICTHRSRRFVTGIPRAMFEACSARTPGGPTDYTHRYDAQLRLSAWLSRQTKPPASVARRGLAGTAQLGPPCQVCEPFIATAPDPHSKTPLETPLVNRDEATISPPA